MRRIKLFDQIHFQPIEVPKQVKDFFSSNPAGDKSLIIKAAATHSGIITRNNGFYLPSEMRSGVSTWTSQYSKPILVHHDQGTDPVGRVIKAVYVDMMGGLKDSKKVRDAFQKVGEVDRFDAYLKGTLSFSEIVDFTVKYFCDSSLMIDDPDYQGLGYIELTAAISDPVAIQKFLDKRYLTGSVGASTDKAVCSICKTDWASSDALCEHRPGSIYDGKKCVLIAGKLSYEEWSVVNTPADRHAKVLEVGNSIQDQVNFDIEHDTIMYSRHVPEILLNDTKGLEPMTIETILSILTTSDKFKELSQDLLQQLSTKIFESLKDQQVEDINKVVLEMAEQLTVAKDEVKDFFGAEYDELVGEDSWGRQYAEMIFTAHQELKDSDPLLAQLLLDKKLSAKARKSLKSSTFCGPDKSFPVPDCAHVTAARRLIGRYKGPGDKESILACVNRKAKKMNCDTKTSDESPKDTGEFVSDDFDRLSDAQYLNLCEVIDKERNICRHMECQQVSESLKNEISKKDALVTELRNELKSNAQDIDSEVKTIQQDNAALLSRLGSLQDQVNRANAQYIYLLRNLSGESVTLEATTAELHDKTVEFIDSLIKETESRVDFKKIHDNLINTGLTRQPTESIQDPTLQVQDIKPGKIEIIDETIDPVTLQRMTRQYQILAKHSKVIADEWFTKERTRYLEAKKVKQN